MQIIFDLDGTLICSRKRLHELFCDLINDRSVDFNHYWRLKFQGASNQSILKDHFGYSENEINSFTIDWMGKIENDFYLEMDSVIDGVPGFLEKISEKHKIYLCTARQSVSQVIKQLENLSLFNYFEEVYVTEQKISKEELLLQSNFVFGLDDWFVGDTGHDIKAGKKLGTKTCAVLTGFMPRIALEKYKPDLILDNASLLKGFL